MRNVKKDDTVHVLSGKYRGKQGPIIEILPKKGKVKVKDVAILTCHKKARKQNDVAGIIKKEGWIDISNVMLVCSSCHKPSKVGFEEVQQGKKTRVCKRCRQII